MLNCCIKNCKKVKSNGYTNNEAKLINRNYSQHCFFSEPTADVAVLDVPVNAVATALKDFFSKHLPPLFEKDVMKELEEIAGTNYFNSNGFRSISNEPIMKIVNFFQHQYCHAAVRHQI